MIISPEEQKEQKINTKGGHAGFENNNDSCKMKRSKYSVTSMNVLVASVSGEQVAKKQMSEKSSQNNWFTCETN